MLTDAEMSALLDVPFKFWICPRGCRKTVVWQGEVAMCGACGFDSGTHRLAMHDVAPELYRALAWLVYLKDDRPHDYEEQKPKAWDAARKAVAHAIELATPAGVAHAAKD